MGSEVVDAAITPSVMPSASFVAGGETHTITLPAPSLPDADSAFLVSLPKAGSTLLTRMVAQAAKFVGQTFFNVPQELRRLGVKPNDTPASLNALYVPKGYIYGGFRGLPGGIQLPDWASGHTVVLVRDPRDMLVSLYFSVAYSHRPPGTRAGGALYEQFQKDRESAQALPLDEYVKEQASQYVKIYEQVHLKLDGISNKTYRYEDVIFSKKDWLLDLAQYLRIPLQEGQAVAIAKHHDIIPDEEDPTKHVRRARPGDHRDKLQPDTISYLDDKFRDILEKYAYL